MDKPPSTRHPLRDVAAFRQALLRWFNAHGRAYPWRKTSDPYAILVSEIMLQQTTVHAVLQNRRFERFLAAFPDLTALAAASEQSLLRAWEGLGYYNRVRNLQRTARALLQDQGGKFPADPAALAALPGIGPYTAGALATFAFNQPVPIVDANIARVLTRLFDHHEPLESAPTRRKLWSWAADLVSPRHPRHFNSALMELGQTLCAPTAPDCPRCPVRAFCTTTCPHSLPVRKPRREPLAVTEHVLFVRNPRGAVLLAREDGSRRRGLWKLPERSPHHLADLPLLATRKYAITHHRVTLLIYSCPPARLPPPPPGAVEEFHPARTLPTLPMPSPVRRALAELLDT